MERRQQAKDRKWVRRASRRERMVGIVMMLGIVIGFVTLWWLQRVHFDFGLLFEPCGFQQRTGLPCPTCGMTTSVLAFARGEILTAFYVQPAATLACGVLVAVAFCAFLTGAFGVYFKAFDRFRAEVKIRYVIVGLLVVVAAGWAVTYVRALATLAPG